MSQNNELLPCPFCGNAIDERRTKCNPKARCKTDGCKGSQLPVIQLDNPEDIAAWNTRAALAAQAGQSEPVALWRYKDTFSVIPAMDGYTPPGPEWGPLYTHPAPVRQPLSEEDITTLGHRMASTYTHRTDPTSQAYGFVRHTLVNFARAIEAKMMQK